MEKKRAVMVVGVFLAVAAIGCGTQEITQREDVPGTPTETVTKIPLSESEDEEESTTEPTKPLQEEVPYELRSSFKEETGEEKDGEFVYFTSAIGYPVFEGKYAENMNRFVTTLTDDFREELPMAKENAKFDYEDSKTDEYRMMMFPEEEEFVVSCPWGKEQYYSFFTTWYSYSGGVHPNTYCKAYVVDMTKGEKEELGNMLRSYGITTEEVVSFATDRIRKEHGEELFETDDESALEESVYGFTKENQWYFNEKGLVLFANPYDIAAYVYGMIECEISYEELEQGLKK